MGKTMKSFLKNYTRRFFPGPGLVRHFDDSATLVRTNRVLSRFFDRDGHEKTYASRNKIFFH